jgi:hypothetical protein
MSGPYCAHPVDEVTKPEACNPAGDVRHRCPSASSLLAGRRGVPVVDRPRFVPTSTQWVEPTLIPAP